MTHENVVVQKLATFRFWAAVAWLIVSPCLVLVANAAYGELPLFFMENRGQADPSVRYLVRSPQFKGAFASVRVDITTGDGALRLRFKGARSARIEGIAALPGRANFLIGPRSQWKVDVPLFAGVTYHNIYSGIDLIYSGLGNQLKSEFVIAPGADPALIRMSYELAERPRVEPDGVLVLPAKSGQFRENAPLIYQERKGRRTPVDGAFRVRRDGTVTFRIGSYDRERPLIIDPVLSYSTYLGGGSMDSVTSLAIDASGNAYFAGWTTSTDIPTLNPVRPQNSGGVDAFVAKLNPGGNALIYCTYLGGRGDNRAFGIAVDPSGNAYVTGWTSSSAFPTASAVQGTLAGGRDAFVAKLNPAGNALVYSTFLGGAANDSGNGIAVDSDAAADFHFSVPLQGGEDQAVIAHSLDKDGTWEIVVQVQRSPGASS